MFADSFDGVQQSYALQAGREVRIMVRPEVVDDVFHHAVRGSVAGDVRDDQVAVVHRVLDGDDVTLAGDLRDVHLHPRVPPGRVEVVEVEFDVILSRVVLTVTEDFAHDSHERYSGEYGINSYVRRRDDDARMRSMVDGRSRPLTHRYRPRTTRGR